MATEKHCAGITELAAVIDGEDKNKQIFVLFTGSPDSAGNSWCPDCVKGVQFNFMKLFFTIF